MLHKLMRCCASLAFALAAGAARLVAGAEKEAAVASKPETVSLPGLKIIGGEKKSVEATGAVSLTNGILEFAAVETEGRDYESLFTLQCKPSALQFALILIGCETGAVPFKVEAGKKVGDRLDIDVEWKADSKLKREPLEQLMINRKTRKVPTDLQWIFTGSYFVHSPVTDKDVFLADSEQAFITLWWNSAIPINLGTEHGNPYQSEAEGFEANPKLIPPKDAPIKLIFRKHGGK